MAAGSSLAVLERTERVSPELVLVDPALAERARSQLADPEDTVARLEALARDSAVAAAARRLAELDTLARQERRSPIRPLAGSGRRASRHPLLIAASATVTLTLALLLGMGADPGGTPTAVETPVFEPPASTVPAPATPAPAPAPRAGKPKATKPKASTPSPSKPGASTPSRPRTNTTPASRPVARPFAWAPAPGASAYHVELFRGAERIFAADTRRAAIDVPARWRFAGRSRALTPGEYRWYVWPVLDGKRSGTATVQATLSIG